MQPYEERFWSKVEKGPDCWVWKEQMRHGYGSFSIDAKYYQAHRIAYLLTRGPIPPGMFVCHACDNPACVNPAHLWLGTNSDNMADMARKRRARHGQAHRATKLTEEQVRELLVLAQTGSYRHRDLARQFGVARSTVTKLINGTTWIHFQR